MEGPQTTSGGRLVAAVSSHSNIAIFQHVHFAVIGHISIASMAILRQCRETGGFGTAFQIDQYLTGLTPYG